MSSKTKVADFWRQLLLFLENTTVADFWRQLLLFLENTTMADIHLRVIADEVDAIKIPLLLLVLVSVLDTFVLIGH